MSGRNENDVKKEPHRHIILEVQDGFINQRAILFRNEKSTDQKSDTKRR